MTAIGRAVAWDRLGSWNREWALALVFGVAAVPWTYGFVAGLAIPLWPSFIASATFFAAGEGFEGLVRGYAANAAGIAYAAATLAITDGLLGGGVLALSLIVGAFMLLASLHEFVPLLGFVPGAFFGYATLFSVDAAGATAFGVAGLPGETLAALVSMLLGAAIGLGTDELSGHFS